MRRNAWVSSWRSPPVRRIPGWILTPGGLASLTISTRSSVADDVGAGRTKPNPDLFLLALDQLKVRKEAAIVFEDSPEWGESRQSAGIFVVAVPNPRYLPLSIENANLTLTSLSDLSLP